MLHNLDERPRTARMMRSAVGRVLALLALVLAPPGAFAQRGAGYAPAFTDAKGPVDGYPSLFRATTVPKGQVLLHLPFVAASVGVSDQLSVRIGLWPSLTGFSVGGEVGFTYKVLAQKGWRAVVAANGTLLQPFRGERWRMSYTQLVARGTIERRLSSRQALGLTLGYIDAQPRTQIRDIEAAPTFLPTFATAGAVATYTWASRRRFAIELDAMYLPFGKAGVETNVGSVAAALAAGDAPPFGYRVALMLRGRRSLLTASLNAPVGFTPLPMLTYARRLR